MVFGGHPRSPSYGVTGRSPRQQAKVGNRRSKVRDPSTSPHLTQDDSERRASCRRWSIWRLTGAYHTAAIIGNGWRAGKRNKYGLREPEEQQPTLNAEHPTQGKEASRVKGTASRGQQIFRDASVRAGRAFFAAGNGVTEPLE